jgi:nitroreductase
MSRLLLPLRYVSAAIQLAWEFGRDAAQFALHSGHSPFEPRPRREFYKMLILSHAVEKGLTLPSPRPLFGSKKISQLLNLLRRYDSSFSNFPALMAHGALSEYITFNKSIGATSSFAEDIAKQFPDEQSAIGGTRTARFGEPHSPADLLQGRASCRNFSTEPLSIEAVSRAVGLGQSAPSQCNRQASKVHFYQDRRRIAELLSLQGGANGFSHTVGNLIIVTSSLPAWGGPNQRNQPYVDGGIFVATLILGFASLGYATCPLNLAVSNSVEKKIRKAGGIPHNERLIAMIAVGKPAGDIARAASSPRMPLDLILTVHQHTSHMQA